MAALIEDPALAEEYLKMESWLDDHPDFVHNYFMRKAKRNMVDAWLLQHTFSQSASGGICTTSPPHGRESSGSESKSSSGATTPARKISAQEFDREGHLLRPIVSNVGGVPTFYTPAPQTPTSSVIPRTRKSVMELKSLDERDLMYELIMDICNEIDVTTLCYKILLNVGFLVKADRCSLFLVKNSHSGKRYLKSKLFDVTCNSTIEECVKNTQDIMIPWGSGIVGHVAQTGEPIIIPDAYADPRFNKDVDEKTGYRTHCILSCPIRDLDGEVVGVAQAINRTSIQDDPFNDRDEKVFMSYLAFCGIGIRNAHLFEKSQLENRRNQLLLDLARVIFEEQTEVASLIHKIMMQTQSLLRCERCQVLLVDEASKFFLDKNKWPKGEIFHPSSGIFSKAFDLQASDFENDDNYQRKGSSDARFPMNIGITGYVAATGETLNIPDVYKDERFDPEVDEKTGFKTRSILCMPIKNAQGQVLGVCQFVNKLDGTPFSKNDEHLFEAFSIFCGLGINNTNMYEKVLRAMAKQRVALDVLSYHASAPCEEVNKLKSAVIPSAQSLKLFDWQFSDFALDDDSTLKASIRMFIELDFLEKFQINNEVICRWLLSVKKNYRNVTYHNWRHAFNVAQTMFWMITQGQMGNILGDVECLALLVACLCHDLDHRGTNNQFQIKTMSPLAQLYSTSVMEHHHFDQCIMILNTKGNEIFGNLSQEQYERVIKVLEHAILATDLALYFRFRGEFFNLVESEKASWDTVGHRELLRSMMMTACDVSAITKPWSVQRRIAELVSSEFFEQGDLEKIQLNLQPMEMMDREKKDKLPQMQVGFIDSICMPVYKSLAQMNDKLEPLATGCAVNREHWNKLTEDEKFSFKNLDPVPQSNKDAEIDNSSQ